MGTAPGDVAALKAKLDALVNDAEEAEEKAVAAHRRARAARTLLEEEQAAAALEKAAVAARQLVLSSSSGLNHTPPSSSSYEETVIADLHLQAAAVLNVRSLVNIVLDSTSTTYASWRDLMMMVLERYALDHVNSDVASSTDPGWRRMDSVVLNWISNSITPELYQVVRERGATARQLWLAIENQFLENREQRTLHLDAAFRNFVQGDLTVSEYCRNFKNMADALADLGSPVDDRILVLNILRGLNPRFEHLGAIIRRYMPFPSFLKVRDDLILEELHLDSSSPPADATALYTCPTPAAARPSVPTLAPPSRPPSNGGTGKKGKNKKNAGGGRGHGGNSDNPTPTPPAPSGTDAKVPASWPTYVNPWQGHIAMYPGPLPCGFQHPQALMAVPGYYPAPGYTPGQQQASYQPPAPANWSPWTGSG
jgi:hypothetical protein